MFSFHNTLSCSPAVFWFSEKLKCILWMVYECNRANLALFSSLVEIYNRIKEKTIFLFRCPSSSARWSRTCLAEWALRWPRCQDSACTSDCLSVALEQTSAPWWLPCSRAPCSTTGRQPCAEPPPSLRAPWTSSRCPRATLRQRVFHRHQSLPNR